jgi:hypothetical protein
MADLPCPALNAGDSLSVCFNTIAVLFVMDIDNLTFDWLLPEKLRTTVEEHGHVELDVRQMKSLARTKPVHVGLICAAILGTVVYGGVNGERATFLSSVAFGLAGAAEAYHRGDNPAEVGQEVTKTALAAGLGGVCYWLLGYGALIRL